MVFFYTGSVPTREQIEDALRGVIDPELRKDIVTLGMVRSIEQPDDETVNVIVSLTTAGCPIRNHFQTAVAEHDFYFDATAGGIGKVSEIA